MLPVGDSVDPSGIDQMEFIHDSAYKIQKKWAATQVWFRAWPFSGGLVA